MLPRRLFHRLIFVAILVISACTPAVAQAPTTNSIPGTGSTQTLTTQTQPVTPTSPVATSIPPTPTTNVPLKVTSSLDGLTSLPHRIQWEVKPDPKIKVSEVDYLIDGQLSWVEKNAPYFYGSDNNYLVTSFLKAVEHTFTVHVITTSGQSFDSTVKANVAASPSLPKGLAGTSWGRTVSDADMQKATSSEPPPAGHWDLTIDSVGWMLHDPQGGGILFDVDYQSGGKVELRQTIEQPPFPNPNGGYFCEEPDPEIIWNYTIGLSGKTLTLHPVDKDPCGDRLGILEGTWTLLIPAAGGLTPTPTP